jgi:hypothetical protein
MVRRPRLPASGMGVQTARHSDRHRGLRCSHREGRCDGRPDAQGQGSAAVPAHGRRAAPEGSVHVIWDNLNVHGDGPTRRWSRFNRRHGGRFVFHYTPKHASWVNLIELFSSIVHRQCLRHGVEPLSSGEYGLSFHHHTGRWEPTPFTGDLDRLARVLTKEWGGLLGFLRLSTHEERIEPLVLPAADCRCAGVDCPGVFRLVQGAST